MFEKTSQLAEKLATGVSRRGFLGSLGGWAAAAAIGVAGVLTGAGTAPASHNRWRCCFYASGQVQGLNQPFPAAQNFCPVINCQGYANTGFTLVDNLNQCCGQGACC